MPRKQTSDRVSRIAAEMMAATRSLRRHMPIGVRVVDLRALCASVLSQDETKGQAKPKRRKR